MSDKINEKRRFNTFQAKYGGLGNADTTRSEFIHTMKVETYGSLAMHNSQLELLSVALNKPKATVKQMLLEKLSKS